MLNRTAVFVARRYFASQESRGLRMSAAFVLALLTAASLFSLFMQAVTGEQVGYFYEGTPDEGDPFGLFSTFIEVTWDDIAFQAAFGLMALVGVPLAIYRYVRRKKEKRSSGGFFQQNFIKILTNLSMVGVCVGTAALVVVLSVFNGLGDLTKRQFRSYNPELLVTLQRGKSFEATPGLLDSVRTLPHVQAVTETIVENALLQYGKKSMIVRLKGVSDNFLEQYPDLENRTFRGEPKLTQDGLPVALVGYGVMAELNVRILHRDKPIPDLSLTFWYPDRTAPIRLDPIAGFDPEKSPSIRSAGIQAGGAFAIDQNYENDVIVPLSFAEGLMLYEGRRTGLEISVTDPAYRDEVQRELQTVLGDRFKVENAEEQQSDILRAVRLEKLFVYVTFIFVLGIAAFNIFFSLAMQAIEKKKDVAILLSMGASQGVVRQVFYLEGAIIALAGTVLGLDIGFVLCHMQDAFGLVGLGVSNAVVSSYPVRMEWPDFALSGATVMAITLLAAHVPARNAARTSVSDEL